MKGLFGAAKAPTLVETPAPAPVIDDASIKKAKKAALTSMAQRSGRASTLLTQASADKLGG